MYHVTHPLVEIILFQVEETLLFLDHLTNEIEKMYFLNKLNLGVSLIKGTGGCWSEILKFLWAWLHFFSSLGGNNSFVVIIFCPTFWAQYSKRFDKSSGCGPFEA